eukprot:jgi/Ulvmu1/5384/UM022_0179.1
MLSKVLSPNYVTLQVDSFPPHDCVQVVCGALPGAVDRDVMLCVEVRGSLIVAGCSVLSHAHRCGKHLRSQVSIAYEHEHMRQFTFPLAIRQVGVSFAYLASSCKYNDTHNDTHM